MVQCPRRTVNIGVRSMKYKEIFDEYNALLSQQSAYIAALSLLIEGYISTKTISGRQYFYLQKIINGKINSEYIKADTLPQVKSELLRRKEIEKALDHVNDEINRIETAVKVLDKSLYHKLIILRRCSLMDSMPVDMREKSVGFGSAIAAIEGIPVSTETKSALSSWAMGQSNFTDGFMRVLAKYNLAGV